MKNGELYTHSIVSDTDPTYPAGADHADQS
jgi:hypothetical protein